MAEYVGGNSTLSTPPRSGRSLAAGLRSFIDAMGGPVSGRMVEHSAQQRQRMAAGDYSPTRPTGENIDLADSVAGGLLGTLKAGKLAAGIRAYHGSPHRFDRFDMSKIGTGEGAQAYGHGLYFAEADDVAKSYRKAGPAADRQAAEMNARMGELAREMDKIAIPGQYRKFRDPERGKQLADEYDELMMKRGDIGALYTTRLDVEPEDLLDWDAPLSEQSEKVRAALEPFLARVRAQHEAAGAVGSRLNEIMDGYTGARLYAQLENPQARDAASAALREAGIPGIRYLDQGSRASGEGTRNFVIFDDKLIDITHVDGKPLTKAERKAAIAAMLAGGMGAMGVASTAEAVNAR